MKLPVGRTATTLEKVISTAIISAFESNLRNIDRTAKELEITRPRLKRYLRKYGLYG